MPRIGGNNWREAFNNKYVNERRRPLPGVMSNTEIVSKAWGFVEHAKGGTFRLTLSGGAGWM